MKDRIRELMEKAKISQREIAKVAGVTAPTVARWITGEVYPRVDEAIALAEKFKVSLQYLCTGSEDTSAYVGFKLKAMTNEDVDAVVQDMDIIKFKKPDIFRNLSERISKIAVVCHRECNYSRGE